MSSLKDPQIAELQAQAGEAARFLKQIANEKRLLILCRLVAGEATVSQLCEVADLSQSAMSQHLSRMRAEGLVEGRRDGLQVFYRITDTRCLGMLQHLKAQFCTAADGLVQG